MKPNLIVFTISYVCALTITSGCSIAYAAEAGDTVTNQSLNLLRQSWDGQRTAIVTGRFKSKLFRYVDVDSKNLSYQTFKAFVEKYVANGQVDEIKRGFSKIPSANGGNGLFADPLVVWVDGPKTRNEWNFVNEGMTNQVANKVFDEQNELWYQSLHKQASVFRGRTGVESIGLKDLRWLPWDDLIKNDKAKCEDVRGGIRVTIDNGVEIYTALPDGSVDRCIFKDKSGAVTAEVQQFIMKQYDGNIVMPKLIVSANFNNSFVYTFDIFLVEEAEVNIDVSPKTFIMSAPTETNIVDCRDGIGKARSIMAHSPVKNILKLVNETPKDAASIGHKGSQPVKRERNTSKRAFLIGCSFLLILFGIILWKRKRRIVPR